MTLSPCGKYECHQDNKRVNVTLNPLDTSRGLKPETIKLLKIPGITLADGFTTVKGTDVMERTSQALDPLANRLLLIVLYQEGLVIET